LLSFELGVLGAGRRLDTPASTAPAAGTFKDGTLRTTIGSGVVRIHLLLGRGDAILLLLRATPSSSCCAFPAGAKTGLTGLPAGSLDGTGYELALGIELRELEPHALHADSELRREGLDAPRGGVGRHEGEHALAQGQACHGSIPYLSHLAMSASSTL